jgi:hypothetical protein
LNPGGYLLRFSGEFGSERPRCGAGEVRDLPQVERTGIGEEASENGEYEDLISTDHFL